MKKNTLASSLHQKYNVLVSNVRVLRKTRQWDSLPAERKKGILSAIRVLLTKLKSLVSPAEFRKIAVAATLVTGFSFSSDAQQFAAPQTNPFGLTFIDTLAFPTLGDMDNDGDLDMFVGNISGDIFYLQNTGNATAPAFAAAQQNPFGLTNVGGGYMTYPSLADMDNDGDLDMFVGDYYGFVHYFQNTGTVSTPAFGTQQVNPFSLTMVPYNASVAPVDMDNDGDLDLFVGDYYGDTHYFQNTGTALAPAFAAEQLNPFGIVAVNYNAAPAPADLDNDGDFDMFIADYNGDIHYFQNTGTATTPAFGPDQLNPFNLSNVGYYVTPAFADMDNDADMDLFVGESYGVIYYFENTGGIGINEPANAQGISIYPNPATQQATIECHETVSHVKATLSDISGQQVLSSESINSNRLHLSLGDLPAGIYLVSVKTPLKTAVYRLVKQ